MNKVSQLLVMATLCLSAATGCKKEKAVEISLVTTARDGQSVQDDLIQLQEGQAMGIRVVAKKKDKLKGKWRIDARSEDGTTAAVAITAEEDEKKQPGDVFVVSGVSEGTTQLRFKLKGKFDVYVDTVVSERPEWEPTVEPVEMGGAASE